MTNYVDVSIFLSEIEIEYIYELYERSLIEPTTTESIKKSNDLANELFKYTCLCSYCC